MFCLIPNKGKKKKIEYEKKMCTYSFKINHFNDIFLANAIFNVLIIMYNNILVTEVRQIYFTIPSIFWFDICKSIFRCFVH